MSDIWFEDSKKEIEAFRAEREKLDDEISDIASDLEAAISELDDVVTPLESKVLEDLLKRINKCHTRLSELDLTGLDGSVDEVEGEIDSWIEQADEEDEAAG